MLESGTDRLLALIGGGAKLGSAPDSESVQAFERGPVRSNANRKRLPGGVKVLLTSVCRPIGAAHGDAPSVGYEVLHGQITRDQGIFSPRSTNHTFALDYIAANLEALTTVLHYPSHAELIRELRKAPTFVGISFNLSIFQRTKEAVAMVRSDASIFRQLGYQQAPL